MTTSTEDKPPQPSEATKRLTSQAEKIREAAKWLIGSFAAVGAALIAGSQLSSIGSLPACAPTSLQCSRLWVALAGSAIALVSVMWAVWIGVALLAPDRKQVSGLKKAWKKGDPAFDYFEADPDQLQGFRDLDDMQQQQEEAYKQFDRLNEEATQGSSGQSLDSELDAAEVVLRDVLGRADDVVTIANHVLYTDLFKRSALRSLLVAAALSAVGIVAFAWAANPGESSLATASLREVTLDGSDLSGSSLRGLSMVNASLRAVDLTAADMRGTDLSHASLDSADLSGANLRGANLAGASLAGVVWSSTTCPDGTNSDAAAGSCVNHLSR